jgi:hypothetical protein
MQGRTSPETSNYIKTLLSINLSLFPPMLTVWVWGESVQVVFLKHWKPVSSGWGSRVEEDLLFGIQ